MGLIKLLQTIKKAIEMVETYYKYDKETSVMVFRSARLLTIVHVATYC
jgi:hypothetical protein